MQRADRRHEVQPDRQPRQNHPAAEEPRLGEVSEPRIGVARDERPHAHANHAPAREPRLGNGLTADTRFTRTSSPPDTTQRRRNHA